MKSPHITTLSPTCRYLMFSHTWMDDDGNTTRYNQWIVMSLEQLEQKNLRYVSRLDIQCCYKLDHTVDRGSPAPVGNYLVSMKHSKYWDYNRINHLPTGAGFLPSTECYTTYPAVSSLPHAAWSHFVASIAKTKLVEWPVVESVPARTEVL